MTASSVRDTLDSSLVAYAMRTEQMLMHARRVAEISVTLAREAGWPGDGMRCIRAAAVLHDIGKIGIPDRILYKPEPLTPTEYEILQQHTLVGAHLLDAGRSAGALSQMARDVALMHHEWWSGHGFPCGLRREEISPAARIVAVANVVDNLSRPRPWRPALPLEKVMMVIHRGRAQRFAPEVVDQLLAAGAEVEKILTRYPEPPTPPSSSEWVAAAHDPKSTGRGETSIEYAVTPDGQEAVYPDDSPVCRSDDAATNVFEVLVERLIGSDCSNHTADCLSFRP